MSLFAYRLADKPSLAYCPYCGRFHRVSKHGVMYHIRCPKSGENYRVVQAVVERAKGGK